MKARLSEIWKVAEYEDVSWRETINLNLKDINKRLETIELVLMVKKFHKPEADILTDEEEDTLVSPDRLFTSFATARDDGIGGIKTCLQMIKSTRIATIQCLWLILCLVLLSYFVIFHYEKVETSREALYKPQKKTRVVDFATEYEEYQMPAFSLIFSNPNNNTRLERDLQEIVDSSEFQCKWTFDVNERIAFGLAKPISINFSNEYALWSVTIEPENPPPIGQLWYCVWIFRSNLSSNAFSKALFFVHENADHVIDGKWRPINLPFYREETAIVSFHYSEKRTKAIGEGIIREFASSINEIHALSEQNTDHNVEVFITMNPQVEYWQEYDDYTLEEAAAALGGIINILAIAYFWVGYYIAVWLAKHSWEMGILPQMSFIFCNLEKILLIKECLDSNNVIPRDSRWFGRAIASESSASTLAARMRLSKSPSASTLAARMRLSKSPQIIRRIRSQPEEVNGKRHHENL